MLGRKKRKEGDRKGTREEKGHMGTKGMEKGQRRQEKSKDKEGKKEEKWKRGKGK